MQLHSDDIGGGAPIPKPLMSAACGGEDRSPSVAWSDAPAGTKSFALILHDADAPIPGGFYHWVVYDLPPSTRGLPAGVKPTAGRIGATTRGTLGYVGPCPPPGPAHHYALTLYALDLSRVPADAALTGPQLERSVEGHVLARVSIEGTASR